jgi:hypothetical protein
VKRTWKPDSIIKVIQSVEYCKLLQSNKARGHYLFHREEQAPLHPEILLDECYISVMYDKEKDELHMIYAWVKSGNISQRIWK